jgi:membrane protein
MAVCEPTGLFLLRAGPWSKPRTMPILPPTENKLETPAAVPIAQMRPVVRAHGTWPQVVALAKYMIQTEVHTYAFSVAANVILALFPFVVLMLTLSHNVFHSRAMENIVGSMMQTLLPTGQSLIMRNARPGKSAQIYSILMLLISSTGVFLPLEVALNKVWGVHKNRSYLHNQAVSLGLSVAVGVLAMASVALTAAQQSVLVWVFFGHTDNIAFRFLDSFLDGGLMRALAVAVSILTFFLIYWILPNRKIPPRSVLPTAIVIGALWEVAKYLYVLALPRLDFRSVYGPFQYTVGLMMWAFLSGLLLLAGAHFSATRFAIAAAREDELEKASEKEADVDRA